MDVEFDNGLVHFECFGKANGFALHSLEMSAEVEIVALDALRAIFANVVTFRIQGFTIALPVISVEVSHLAASQLAAQVVTTGISAPSQNPSRNVSGVAVTAIPEPTLLLFVMHKTPLLIHFQRQNARRHSRFRSLGRCLAQHR